jgi:hypothetical protein
MVARGGHAYICVRDNPGVPGQCEDWMLLASQGKVGNAGPRGSRGAKGEKGDAGDLTIRSWLIDPTNYRASPLLSNGQVGAMLELRPLFVQFRAETV